MKKNKFKVLLCLLLSILPSVVSSTTIFAVSPIANMNGGMIPHDPNEEKNSTSNFSNEELAEIRKKKKKQCKTFCNLF